MVKLVVKLVVKVVVVVVVLVVVVVVVVVVVGMEVVSNRRTTTTPINTNTTNYGTSNGGKISNIVGL